MLSDLHISNFRGFEDLRLDNLGRVNLVVGKNNTGKTSLLEAVTLIATQKQPTELRSAYRVCPKEEAHFDRWLIRDGADSGEASVIATNDGSVHSCKVASAGGGAKATYQGIEDAKRAETQGDLSPLAYIHSSVRTERDLIVPFAETVRKRDGEKTLEAVMRAVDPRVQTIRLSTGRTNQTFIEVDLGLSARLPITQAGEGLNRVLTMLVELLGASRQFAFLDEVENGIHHTAMLQVWKALAEVAERTNVQIFATTHSHECLEAAHEAFAERGNYDLRVIQLYRVDQKTDGRVLDRKLIEAALAGEIELR